MAKRVLVEWLGEQVKVPALDRLIAAGDQLEMEEAEARDREAAGQVRIIHETEDVARATPRSKGKEAQQA